MKTEVFQVNQIIKEIVSHRLPNARELNAGCSDWLDCCNAYVHRKGCATGKPTSDTHGPTDLEPSDRERVRQIRRWLMLYVSANSDPYADLTRAFREIRFLLALLSPRTDQVQEKR